ncbi:L,D-transpeptidase [Alkalilimnicola sp. S0819]|uniref:L,D-transpeptidase n=1 Tax=Alkalilimnicola sp. S0819 TaxID=2613922 RepID=UPI0012629959|nr:L,D-transpeptidase [Alkalilimnicola sp. S0819]KAB7627452.1 L,D-transpeptidase [Alkalilimnicola sp. S0819]MPQ15601.1 L,D-transpeptidase family protein [Alkalilimnicola sp. S0819]
MSDLTRGRWIEVDLGAQCLILREGEAVLAEHAVSTAVNGPGEREGSGCTPRGWHRVRARIGAGLPAGTVFRARRPTGEVYDEALGREQPGRDWILTRILWLSGLEPGRNRLGDVDSMRRYIYIHGCPDTFPMGRPLSKGCVRMRNAELIALFDRVPAGTPVYLHE